MYTCHIISYSHCSECDHNKVDCIQCGPAFYVFEDNSRDGDENNAAGKDEQDDRRHPYFCLADLFVFLLRQSKNETLLECNN